MQLEKNIINIVVVFSIAYLITTFLMPETQMLLWATASLIVVNYALSIIYLFRQGKITISVTFLNIVQLALFCRLHVFIHDLLGASHYIYAVEPNWYDWIELVAVHVLRAVDLLDILGAYGVHLQNIKHHSLLTGIMLFGMHIMVDIFLLGTIFMIISQRSASQQASTMMKREQFIDHFKNLFKLLKRVRIVGLIMTSLLILGTCIIGHWNFGDLILWPLDNILRTLDFGDAFQIFDWRLHNIEMNIGLATLAVVFRLFISFFLFGPVNRFYLYLLKGRGKTIDELVKIATSSESLEEVDIAIKALIRFGPPVMPYLVQIFTENKNSIIRRFAVEALDEIRPIPASIVPHLVTRLVDSDNSVRNAAAFALKGFDPQWQKHKNVISSTSHILEALKDDEPDVRFAAINVLNKIDCSVEAIIPQLLEALGDNEANIRLVVAEMLKKVDFTTEKFMPSEKFIPYFLKASEDNQAHVRLIAKKMLNDINFNSEKAISSLIEMLGNNEVDVRLTAAEILKKTEFSTEKNFSAEQVVSPLLKALKDDEPDVRFAAINVLNKIDCSVETIIPQLVEAMGDNEIAICLVAAKILKKIDFVPEKNFPVEKMTPYLLKALTNNMTDVYSVADEMLQKIDVTFETSFNYLVKTLGYDKAVIRFAVAKKEKIIPHLVKLLLNDKKSVRDVATMLLKKIDPHWQKNKLVANAIPYLVKALSDRQAFVRRMSAKTLGQIGKMAVKAIPALVKTLKDDSQFVSWAAEEALNKIDPAGQL
ncbi:sister chromatid cohesion protein PDS5 [Candidatus Parabeggiatoa sp. HSG14]|uniref:sister chromatid cohesion protein PDS5 n=1 Tax=Candidatus Parabeggiatoa sp. HSG14 TaxID=3055593 RepID=UPI0025A76D9C|nr:HEAT repeat domain-containing protein [Thiotrichales bacterium HSG14]